MRCATVSRSKGAPNGMQLFIHEEACAGAAAGVVRACVARHRTVTAKRYLCALCPGGGAAPRKPWPPPSCFSIGYGIPLSVAPAPASNDVTDAGMSYTTQCLHIASSTQCIHIDITRTYYIFL